MTLLVGHVAGKRRRPDRPTSRRAAAPAPSRRRSECRWVQGPGQLGRIVAAGDSRDLSRGREGHDFDGSGHFDRQTLKSWKSRPAAPMITTRLRSMYPALPQFRRSLSPGSEPGADEPVPASGPAVVERFLVSSRRRAYAQVRSRPLNCAVHQAGRKRGVKSGLELGRRQGAGHCLGRVPAPLL